MSEPLRPAGRRSNRRIHPAGRNGALSAAALALAILGLIAVLPGLSSGASLQSIQSKLESKRAKLQQVQGRADGQALAAVGEAVAGRRRWRRRAAHGRGSSSRRRRTSAAKAGSAAAPSRKLPIART